MQKISAYWHPEYSFEFPESHRFPMEKFDLLYRYLSGDDVSANLHFKRASTIKTSQLQKAHCRTYIESFIHNRMDKKAQRRLGIPWSQELVTRSLISPGGTLETALTAMDQGIACHLAGGTHHAHYDFASGFCIFNDLAVTALELRASKRAERVLIFDLDVHQGDGTASILHAFDGVHTVSIHGEKNFPARKAESDVDIGLPDGCSDDQYLETVEHTLSLAINSFRPDVVLYDAGVDVFIDDPLGRLSVSFDGLRQRENLVLRALKSYGIPVATVIGGGYDDDRVALARRHALVVEEAIRVYCLQG